MMMMMIRFFCIDTKSVSPAVFEILSSEHQTYWGHDLDLLASRDVTGHVTIRLAQESAKSGPRAKSGMQALLMRPVSCNIMTGRAVTCGVDHGLAFHTHNQWPWLSEQCTAIWYSTISSLQPPHQQQHDSWDSTKWQVGHPTPSFT